MTEQSHQSTPDGAAAPRSDAAGTQSGTPAWRSWAWER